MGPHAQQHDYDVQSALIDPRRGAAAEPGPPRRAHGRGAPAPPRGRRPRWHLRPRCGPGPRRAVRPATGGPRSSPPEVREGVLRCQAVAHGRDHDPEPFGERPAAGVVLRGGANDVAPAVYPQQRREEPEPAPWDPAGVPGRKTRTETSAAKNPGCPGGLGHGSTSAAAARRVVDALPVCRYRRRTALSSVEATATNVPAGIRDDDPSCCLTFWSSCWLPWRSSSDAVGACGPTRCRVPRPWRTLGLPVEPRSSGARPGLAGPSTTAQATTRRSVACPVTSARAEVSISQSVTPTRLS